MRTGTRLASILWLSAGPLFAQMAQQPSMPAMDHHATEHSSPSQFSMQEPELLQGVAARTPRTLAEFLAMADKNNPTLKQAAAVIARSEGQARQAALYPNPTIGYQGDQIRGGSYGGGEQGGFVEQTVVLGGKLGLRRNIYEQEKQSGKIGAEVQQLRVHNDVMQMFYSAVGAQQTVRVRGHLLALAKDAVQTAHQLANVGQADAPDVLQAEVEAEQAAIDYTVAQRVFLQNFKQLAGFAGVPDLELAPLDAVFDAPPDIDPAKMADTMVEQSPEVREAQQQTVVAEARQKSIRREIVPDLQLRAGEQANLEALGDVPGKKTGAQSFASAGIELPLWNRNQGSSRAAQADVEQARQEVTRTRLALQQQSGVLVQNYLSAKTEADRYRNALLPRARKAYELYLEKYQDMAQAYPQVIVSQRTLFELEVHYIDALGAVWQNAIALQNFGLQGGLSRPASPGSN
jgi:outer membrane protein, heavy metal efflux system